MTIKGYQFDRAKVTALKDASLYSMLHLDQSSVIPDRGNELSVNINGLDAVIQTGQAIICGRLIEVTEPETVSIPANTAGFLCITIDLSEINSSEGTPGSSDYVFTNNQLRCEFLETLTQQELNDGGMIYTFNLGAVSSNSSAVTYTKNDAAYDKKLNFQNGLAIAGNTLDSANFANTGWVSVSLNSGFSSLSGNPVQVKKIKNLDGTYTVKIRGVVQGSTWSTVNNVFATLPVEYRASRSEVFYQATNLVTGGRLLSNPSGEFSFRPESITGLTYVSLAGIQYEM